MTDTPKTVPLASVITAMERELGFRGSNIRQVARRLSEARILPAGGPHASPMLDFRDIGTLILALGADATIPNTPDAVLVLDKLVPEGIDPSEFPEPVKSRMTRAGHSIDVLIESAVNDDDALRSVRWIEIVSSWPEISIAWADGHVERFREPGKLATHWGGNHMRSVKISGKALFYAVRRMFADEAADAA